MLIEVIRVSHKRIRVDTFGALLKLDPSSILLQYKS